MGMEMPGQSWAATAVSFLGMWTVMTAAMMLPSLVPVLVRYRRDLVGAGALRAGILAVIATVGYLAVWVAIGVLAYPLTMLVDRLGAAGAGVLVAIAFAYQWAPRKARDLACCRLMFVRSLPGDGDARTAWRHGARYGRHCARCSANLMAIPILLGTMNLWLMVLVGAVITAERWHEPRLRPSVLDHR